MLVGGAEGAAGFAEAAGAGTVAAAAVGPAGANGAGTVAAPVGLPGATRAGAAPRVAAGPDRPAFWHEATSSAAMQKTTSVSHLLTAFPVLTVPCTTPCRIRQTRSAPGCQSAPFCLYRSLSASYCNGTAWANPTASSITWKMTTRSRFEIRSGNISMSPGLCFPSSSRNNFRSSTASGSSV